MTQLQKLAISRVLACVEGIDIQMTAYLQPRTEDESSKLDKQSSDKWYASTCLQREAQQWLKALQ